MIIIDFNYEFKLIASYFHVKNFEDVMLSMLAFLEVQKMVKMVKSAIYIKKFDNFCVNI